MKNMDFKIFCLGNEFIKEDSLAKKVGEELGDKFDVFMIKDSFQLMEGLSGKFAKEGEEIIVLDVVENLNNVRLLDVEDLRVDSILSAHDFDAGFVLKLLRGRNIKIIGIPQSGDFYEIVRQVKKTL